MTTSTTRHGRLHFFSETGTEGGWYAWQDDAYIHRFGEPCFSVGAMAQTCPVADGSSDEHWGYEGLRMLHDGDYLVVYDRDGAAELFRGDVVLTRREDVYESADATVFGLWVNQEPAAVLGVDREQWASWFLHEFACSVVPADPTRA